MVKKKTAKRRTIKKKADTNPAATVQAASKADSIRDAVKTIGPKARPKDVIKALADKGVTVSSSQVSTMMVKLKAKRKAKPNSKTNGHTGNGARINIDHLLAAKNLAAKVGGIETAQTALAQLAKLMN